MTSNSDQERFVGLFIDWKPDESLEPADREKKCMVGLMSSSEEGVPGLNKYGKVRTRKRKLRAARKLLDHLYREVVELDVVAAAGMSNGVYVRWACDAINRIRSKIGAEWTVEGSTPTSLLWNGNVYPRSNVLGISLYAGLLPIIALRAKTRLEGSRQPVKHIKVCLDNLPLDAEAGTLLLNQFYQDDDIMAMWKENMRKRSVNHTLAQCGFLF
jgi:hypothetical protein